MKLIPVDEVQGAMVIETDRYTDDRGYFQELFSSAREYPMSIEQANLSLSKENTVRGLHVVPFAKLCTCAKGALFDVVADVRPDSPTYLGWYGVWLSEENHKQLYVPAGCAHGFFAAKTPTLLIYMQDSPYNPSVESEVNWQDPQLGIEWPPAVFAHAGEDYVLSDKDKAAPFLEVPDE